MKQNNKNQRGLETQQKILAKAVAIASAKGLESLTIGLLAKELNMSKSGLFGHFGSKENLQMATLAEAEREFKEHVVDPVINEIPGLVRLQKMLHHWLLHIENSQFRGGCFFSSVAAEFDSRPGSIRSKVAELTQLWLTALSDEIATAQKLEQLTIEVAATQLAFEFRAFVQEANLAFHLLDNKQAFVQAKQAIYRSLQQLLTTSGQKIFKSY